MVYFCYTDIGDGAPAMSVLDATDDEAALSEAEVRLRDYPGARSAHVFNGDQSVGTVDAPDFGFAGVNNTVGFGSHPTDPDPIPSLTGETATLDGDR